MTFQKVKHIGHDAAGQTIYLILHQDADRRPVARIEIGDGSYILLDHLDPKLIPALRRSCNPQIEAA